MNMSVPLISVWATDLFSFSDRNNTLVLWFATSAVAYLMYYVTKVAKAPKVIHNDESHFGTIVRENLTLLQEKFYPTPWCVSSHLQTAVANMVRSAVAHCRYHREYVELSDGGILALDWLPDDSPDDTKPIAYFMPGLTGDSQTVYIKTLLPVAAKLGCRCVVFNNRGRGGVDLRTPKTYCALSTNDVKEALLFIKKKYPKSRIIATGVSLGGVILGHYLAEAADESLVDAALLVSVVYDIQKAVVSMETRGLNLFLNRHLARSLCRVVKPHKHQFSTHVDMDHVMQSRTIKEFDDRFTSKIFGFSSIDHYYDMATLNKRLAGISVPTLCLSAADDMFQPLDALPLDRAVENPHLVFVVTARGGHIGFMDGILPTLPLYSERLYGQYLAMLLERFESIPCGERWTLRRKSSLSTTIPASAASC